MESYSALRHPDISLLSIRKYRNTNAISFLIFFLLLWQDFEFSFPSLSVSFSPLIFVALGGTLPCKPSCTKEAAAKIICWASNWWQRSRPVAAGNQWANNGNPRGSRALGPCRLAHMWFWVCEQREKRRFGTVQFLVLNRPQHCLKCCLLDHLNCQWFQELVKQLGIWSWSKFGFCTRFLAKDYLNYIHMTHRQPITKREQDSSIPTTTTIIPDVKQSLYPNGRFKVPFNGLCVGAPQAPWLTHSEGFRSNTHNVYACFFVWTPLRAFPTQKKEEKKTKRG